MSAVNAEVVLTETIKRITGIGSGQEPLGGVAIVTGEGSQKEIADFFTHILAPGDTVPSHIAPLVDRFNKLKETFVAYYSEDENNAFLAERWETLTSSDDLEIQAKAVTEIWAPETAMEADDTFPRWQLKDVVANATPYKPEEVIMPLNAMYGLPDTIPTDLADDLKVAWEQIKDDTDEVFFDYDHPVYLFASDDQHELIKCLEDLNGDVAFEKDKGTFTVEHRLIVPVSVSVTHPRIDRLTGMWLNALLADKKYDHLRIFILTEENTAKLRKAINFAPENAAIFSVLGKYGNHFNVLKYFQLLSGKAYGTKASFKLDTDEGIRSADIFASRNRTWFDIMCHKYWGGTATDAYGREVYLGVNAGEYMNEADIDEIGYPDCMREPDVKIPKTLIDPQIFFNKGVAHTKATKLKNTHVNKLEDFIATPLIFGGGYGVDNASLRKFVPFTFSEVGRAEDQQFYLAGLAKGNSGLWGTDCRIAHYKQSSAVTEHTTEASRFIGDMFRLVIFQHIVGFLGVKQYIDPMPGVFAGRLARVQAFFNLLYKSYSYFATERPDDGQEIYARGLKELDELQAKIDSGKIRTQWDAEQKEWQAFIAAVDATPVDQIKQAFDSIES